MSLPRTATTALCQPALMLCPRGLVAVSSAVRAAEDSPVSSPQPTKVIEAFRWRPSPTGVTATHGSNPQFHFPIIHQIPRPLHTGTQFCQFLFLFLFLFFWQPCPRKMPSRMVCCFYPGSPFFLAASEFGSGGRHTHVNDARHERFGGGSAFSPTYPERTARWGELIWFEEGGEGRYISCRRSYIYALPTS